MSDFFNRTLDNLRGGPLGPAVRWIEDHPRLSSWIVLGLGMALIVAFSARDVGLQPGQWVAIIAATVLVAGACVWIISWEDEDEEPETSSAEAKVSPAVTNAKVAAATTEETPKAAPAKAASKPAAKKTTARKTASKSTKKTSK
jgi:hypothetical protein